jgi:hypothetical protein
MGSLPHDDFSAVPLFPLPNVVLFPRAILPLHIFEDRYKTMTADALGSNRRIAMALLKPGWEKNYYQRPAIEPIVCIGEILSWEKLPDGKYNFLLQGRTRARVKREHARKTYRLADLERLPETPAMEIDLETERRRLIDLFTDGALARIPVGGQFRELLGGPLSTPDLADLAAFNFLEDVDLKQGLLEEIDVRRRVGRVVDALEAGAQRINPGLHGFPVDPGMN